MFSGRRANNYDLFIADTRTGRIRRLTTSALPTGDVGAWLRAITARKALDWLRQDARRRERSLPEPGEGAAPDRAHAAP